VATLAAGPRSTQSWITASDGPPEPDLKVTAQSWRKHPKKMGLEYKIMFGLEPLQAPWPREIMGSTEMSRRKSLLDKHS